MTRQAADDDLTVYEYKTAPFTSAELEAIARYREATAGAPDTLDGFELAHVHWHVSEFGSTETYPVILSLATTLGSWYLALDAALADLLTCTTESTTYSTAAARFLKAESETYH
ncbi:hypothetical protein [Streptomyces sp. NPDC058701]|uniref:hypothetical protein n=1 Tax=Streptomyces sp. NPDC058701 TaxID=3346608 RepID=UPI003651485E